MNAFLVCSPCQRWLRHHSPPGDNTEPWKEMAQQSASDVLSSLWFALLYVWLARLPSFIVLVNFLENNKNKEQEQHFPSVFCRQGIAFCKKGSVVEYLWGTLLSWCSPYTLTWKERTEARWKEETGLIFFSLQCPFFIRLGIPLFQITFEHPIELFLNWMCWTLGKLKFYTWNFSLNKLWYLPCNKLVVLDPFLMWSVPSSMFF